MTDHAQPSIAALAEQVETLGRLVGSLRSDFDAAKAEGAEQVAELRAVDERLAAAAVSGLDDMADRIGAAREYAELLNERRCNDVARLETMIRETNEMLARLRSDIERRFDDVRRTAGRW